MTVNFEGIITQFLTGTESLGRRQPVTESWGIEEDRGEELGRKVVRKIK